MSSVLTAAAPSSSLVIRREKRRRRKNAPRYGLMPPAPPNSSYSVLTRPLNVRRVLRSAPAASTSAKRPRRGFVFSDAPASDDRRDESDSDAWRPAAAAAKKKSSSSTSTTSTATTAPTFAFRVKHGDGDDDGTSGTVDADAASAALREQREKAEKLEQRRLRLQKKKEESEREARLEAEVQETLSADQATLYHIVHAQVKRELRKTKKQFAKSSGRHDVINLSTLLSVCESGHARLVGRQMLHGYRTLMLTVASEMIVNTAEKTFHALKRELIEFMRVGPPTNDTVRPRADTMMSSYLLVVMI